MGKVYAKLGVPESPEAYVLDNPDDLPDGIDWNEKVAGEVKTLAHEAKLTQSQLDAFVKFDVARTLSRAKATAEEQVKFAEESTAALKKEIGGGEWSAFLANSEKAFKLADEEIKKGKGFNGGDEQRRIART